MSTINEIKHEVNKYISEYNDHGEITVGLEFVRECGVEDIGEFLDESDRPYLDKGLRWVALFRFVYFRDGGITHRLDRLYPVYLADREFVEDMLEEHRLILNEAYSKGIIDVPLKGSKQ